MQVILHLLGAGGHASVVADVARRAGYADIRLWYESLPDDTRFAVGTTFSAISDLPAATPVVLAVGDITARKRWRQRFPTLGAPVTDPSAVVGHGVSIGSGVVLMPGVIVNANARIESDAILNSGCVVEHDCCVGTNSHVSPGAHLGGAAIIGANALIGTGAVVLPGVPVGDGAIVGAGAVVTKPVAENQTVVGVPARPLARR